MSKRNIIIIVLKYLFIQIYMKKALMKSTMLSSSGSDSLTATEVLLNLLVPGVISTL